MQSTGHAGTQLVSLQQFWVITYVMATSSSRKPTCVVDAAP